MKPSWPVSIRRKRKKNGELETVYTAAMIETDVDNLGVLIEETSRGIEVRLDELKKSQNGCERKEIADVANALVALKADRIALDEPDADDGDVGDL
jgi:hypothetical protein